MFMYHVEQMSLTFFISTRKHKNPLYRPRPHATTVAGVQTRYVNEVSLQNTIKRVTKIHNNSECYSFVFHV